MVYALRPESKVRDVGAGAVSKGSTRDVILTSMLCGAWLDAYSGSVPHTAGTGATNLNLTSDVPQQQRVPACCCDYYCLSVLYAVQTY